MYYSRMLKGILAIFIINIININCQSEDFKNKILYEKSMSKYYHLVDTFDLLPECLTLTNDSIQQRICSDVSCFNFFNQLEIDSSINTFSIRFIVPKQGTYPKACTNYIKKSKTKTRARTIATYTMERNDSLDQGNNFFQEISGFEEELDENTQEIEKLFFINKTFQLKNNIRVRIYLSAKLP